MTNHADETTNTGSAVRIFRAAAGLTQAQLAQRAGGLSAETVCRIERGHHEPRVDTARRLAAALGIGVELLLETPENEKTPLAGEVSP